MIANDFVLSVSPGWFRPATPDKAGTWLSSRVSILREQARAFVEREFGGHVVALVLHLDEATPHVQGVMIPLLKTTDPIKPWRLSSKDRFDRAALRGLQRSWEELLVSHGVSRRTVGSRVRHVPMKRYYAAIDSVAKMDPQAKISVREPPCRGRMELDSTYQNRIFQWRKAEDARLQKIVKQLAQAAVQGVLAARAKRDETEIHYRLAQALSRAAAAERSCSSLSEGLRAFKPVAMSEIAALFGKAQSEIPDGSSPLEAIMRLGGFNRDTAIRFAVQRLGPANAANTLRDDVIAGFEKQRLGPTILTADQRRAIEAQEAVAEAATHGVSGVAAFISPTAPASEASIDTEPNTLRL